MTEEIFDELDEFLASIEENKKNMNRVKRYLYEEVGYLGKNGLYWATHPHMLISETFWHIKSQIKWFIQRGRRGFSNYDLWSFDSYLSRMLPAAFDEMRRISHGHPGGLTPEEWDGVLEELAQGFREYHELYIGSFKKIGMEDNEKWERTIRLFGRWYGHLWD